PSSARDENRQSIRDWEHGFAQSLPLREASSL
ncbi:MAG: hypothetical protein ACI9QQ_001106, partial [Myxococcota bacterium]